MSQKKLTEMQTLILWALLAKGGEGFQKDILGQTIGMPTIWPIAGCKAWMSTKMKDESWDFSDRLPPILNLCVGCSG